MRLLIGFLIALPLLSCLPSGSSKTKGNTPSHCQPVDEIDFRLEDPEHLKLFSIETDHGESTVLFEVNYLNSGGNAHVYELSRIRKSSKPWLDLSQQNLVLKIGREKNSVSDAFTLGDFGGEYGGESLGQLIQRAGGTPTPHLTALDQWFAVAKRAQGVTLHSSLGGPPLRSGDLIQNQAFNRDLARLWQEAWTDHVIVHDITSVNVMVDASKTPKSYALVDAAFARVVADEGAKESDYAALLRNWGESNFYYLSALMSFHLGGDRLSVEAHTHAWIAQIMRYWQEDPDINPVLLKAFQEGIERARGRFDPEVGPLIQNLDPRSLAFALKTAAELTTPGLDPAFRYRHYLRLKRIEGSSEPLRLAESLVTAPHMTGLRSAYRRSDP